MARVDIIVPCYGYGRFLEDCVHSVLSQSHANLRVLIIDDASPDNTEEVSAALVASDPRVSAIRHSRNLGHIATYNEGLEWADGDYVVLLSADDLLAPGALRRAVMVMEAHPEVSLLYGGFIELFPGDHIPVLADNPATDQVVKVVSGIDFIKSACQFTQNVVPTPTAFGRNAIQKCIGGYRPELPHAGDMEMWLRYAAHGSVACLEAVQALKREHGENMSNPYMTHLLKDMQQRQMVFEWLFAEHGKAIPEAACLHDLAKRMIAERAFWYAVRKLVEGYPRLALDFYRFALSIRPQMRFRPPLARLLRTEQLPRKIGAAVRQLAFR